MVKELPSNSNVTRQCTPTQISNGRPVPAAFELKGHDYLSVCHIEHFLKTSEVDNMLELQKEFISHRQIGPNDQFAVLNVGNIVKKILELVELKIWVNDLEEDAFPSHSGIYGYGEDDLDVPIVLSDAVDKMYKKLT